MIKDELKEKYASMLSGETPTQNKDIVIENSDIFLSHYKELIDRLKREDKEINDALIKINDARFSRIKSEREEKARAAKEAKQREEEAKRERELLIERRKRAEREEEARKKAKRDLIETVFQIVAFSLPIIMSVVFAIILFSNTEQISIISNFTGWCVGWVFFVVASLIVSISLFVNRHRNWNADDKKSRISAIVVSAVVVVCSIVVFSNSSNLSSKFDPTNFIVWSVMGKTTSTSRSTYYSTISFNLNNTSKVRVTYVCGEMRLYNGVSEVGAWNVYFEGDYCAGQSYNTSVKFEETNDSKLYKTAYENLGITYRITSMKFNGDYKEHTYNGKIITLKAGSTSGSYENKYDEAISLYNQEKYEEALDIFESLSGYRESSAYITKCKNQINEQKYQQATSLLNSGKYDEAIALFEQLDSYKDSETQIEECKYRKAKDLYSSNNLPDAYSLFLEISPYKDSATYINSIQNDADALAKSYAVLGNYDKSINLLESVGKSRYDSELYSACNKAINGDYRSFVNLVNPTKVIVFPSLKTLATQAFYNCSKVEEIVLPESLTTIASYAFSGCTSISKINLPKSITSIGDRAFRDCTSLTSITIPDGLIKVGENVLTGCTSLQKITTKLSEKYYLGSFFSSSYTVSSASWPSSLTEIVITSGTIVPNGFFQYLPSTISKISFQENIVEVKKDAFYGCKIGLLLPTTVKTIGESAYAGLGRLEDSIALHEGVESVGSYAFQSTYFKSIHLPKSLKSIGESVFGSYSTNTILKEIFFGGTKEQWLSIIDSKWSDGMSSYYTVDCTDAVYEHSLYGGEWTNK